MPDRHTETETERERKVEEKWRCGRDRIKKAMLKKDKADFKAEMRCVCLPAPAERHGVFLLASALC